MEKQFAIEHGPFIVYLPSYKMVIFHSKLLVYTSITIYYLIMGYKMKLWFDGVTK